ncbi:MAG TPA: WD40 repeat domain-containing protein [Campylobacteraceae bacterium]|nr:WD40 repeat domain-containing protein [Campylobacteraceae bacterium]
MIPLLVRTSLIALLVSFAAAYMPQNKSSVTAGIASHGNKVYRLEKVIKFPGTYYFTPMTVCDRFGAFGYISKTKPTPQEVAAEKKRISRIIEGTIRREYGTLANWEMANKKIAGQTAAAMKQGMPAWVKSILPPELVQEALPLLLKGALLYAVHSGDSTEPYGNLGETGIVLVDSSGQADKIRLGLDEAVVSLDFSPDGRRLAVLTDLGYEDRSGRYHAAGRISLVDTAAHRVIRQWVFANAVHEVKFTPDGKALTFLMRNPKKWREKAIRFIDIDSGKMLPKSLLFHCADATGDFYGMKRRALCYTFAPDFNTLVIRQGGKLGFYDAKTLGKRFETAGSGTFISFAHHAPLLFEESGRLIDYAKGILLRKLQDPLHIGFVDAAFTPDDSRLLVSDHFRKIFVFDPLSGRKIAETRFPARDGAALFELSNDGRWIITPQPVANRYARYGSIKRRKNDLHIVDSRSLQTVQRISLPKNETLLAFETVGEHLFFSDFDTIYLYKEIRRSK